jgi:hypothetical protein
MPARLLALALFAALTLRVACGQEQNLLGVVARTVDGDEIRGLMSSLDSVLELATPEDGMLQIARDRLVQLAAASPVPREAADSAQVLLVNGDVLVGRTERVEDDVLQLQWTGPEPAIKVLVPLEFVQSIVFEQPDEVRLRRRLMRQWGLSRVPTDRVLLLNGAVTEGELLRVDTTGVVLETTLGEVRTPLDQVAALTMNSGLATQPSLPDQYAVLSCVDGSRVTVTALSIDEQEVTRGTATCSFPVQLEWDRILRIHFFGQRVVPLVHLTPSDDTHTPYLTRQHPLVLHRNVYGGRLEVRGARGQTGLGMHSESDVSFDLVGEDFKTFHATVGVDDMAEGRGKVVFAVELDGKRVFESSHAGREEPILIGPLNVAEARTLTLRVEYGKQANIRDAADWLDPILIR